ncbi:pentatricopeptide repeat-containing protein At3g02330, mitochondrial isoform X1 [Dendrobium catenatum]|uniref:Pentatricopeptide repeat-containing protein n=1 Tax=Dendrobium catenatum TaxID=906689 RepID=A0A2I0VLU1_9ASPA|nr:pentatricopeptide repeat-containing protein At3g02330, mitochondrial isoform X1 [Dendrobium catenatum]XP_028556712.1 pentatricopeptide repeat-containing protein At3g02330, mitochondrial isoform X1 [Dendrobium catenatum]PKU64380.1 Pentatricopeptide repeat-containing protein [Dendrobium catenatum]
MVRPALINLSASLPKLLSYSSLSNCQSCASPSAKLSFSRLFQECSELRKLSTGRQTHSQMITSGFIPTTFVSNCLIQMYIRCIDLDSACKVFDEMPDRDVVSWNAIISGYVQTGLMREAQCLFKAMPDCDVISWNSMISGYMQNGNLNESVELFLEMMKIGVEPDRITFSIFLKLISSWKAYEMGIQIHGLALKMALALDVVTGSALVDMYAKCGSLGDSLCFFREMPQRNWVTWSAIIGGCAQNEQFMDGFDLFLEMQREGIGVSQSSYASLFRSCAGLPCLEVGKQLHGHAMKNNFISDVVVGTATLDMYAKCDSLSDAMRMFWELPNRSRQTCNAMIVGFGRNDRGIEALKLFKFMNISCILADEISLSAVLSACAEAKAYLQGMQVHCLAIKTSHSLNICVKNAILDMYGKCRALVNGCNVFEEMEQRDSVSWNVIITALEQNGLYEETFSHLNQMLLCSLEPDVFTYGSVVKACAALQSLDFGRLIHGRIIKSWLGSDSFVGSALIDMYCKCGMLEEAQALHDRIESQTMVSWNAIISGFSLQKKSEEAQKFFSQMLELGLQPDNFTYATILDTCANLAMMGLGKQIHSQLLKQELHKDVFISSTLVDMYSKCGNMQDALLMFEKMPERDFVSWNAIIYGYANHGLGFEALSMFERMKMENITPNHATFIAVLRACGHVGLVDEGLCYFESMNQVYNLEPELEHYSCMVNLLGRSRGVHEALDVINYMPYEADAVIWRALLSACKIHRNVEIAELALEKILLLEPDDSSACILLSNIYAEVGRWDQVSRMRKMMRRSLMKKEPGCSWIEVNSEMHAFIVGDISHPLSELIFKLLDNLIGEMILAGYKAVELDEATTSMEQLVG